jgi:hypothetical protein
VLFESGDQEAFEDATGLLFVLVKVVPELLLELLVLTGVLVVAALADACMAAAVTTPTPAAATKATLSVVAVTLRIARFRRLTLASRSRVTRSFVMGAAPCIEEESLLTSPRLPRLPVPFL